MSNKKIIYVITFLMFSFFLFGCSASSVEERRGETPKEKEQVDTVLTKSNEVKEPESIKEKEQPVKVENVEVEKEEKVTEQTITKVIFYSVQLGAFQKISNVEKFERVIKAKFPDMLIRTEQDANTGYYKVTVGKFQNKDDAYNLRDYCVQQGYKDAWVTETAK